MHFPLFFDMNRLPCLLIGGGKVAAHKADTLMSSGCRITVIAPDAGEQIRGLAARGEIQWRVREYNEGDCTGFGLVIAATPHREVNRKISLEARNKGIPVNVVDDPELCSVIFGAVWQEGSLSAAVSTGGAAPFVASAIRDRIGPAIRGCGSWVEAAARFRIAVREAILDLTERKGLYRKFIDRMASAAPGSAPAGCEFADWMQWLDCSQERPRGEPAPS
jgi:siroheme synthase-like protein